MGKTTRKTQEEFDKILFDSCSYIRCVNTYVSGIKPMTFKCDRCNNLFFDKP